MGKPLDLSTETIPVKCLDRLNDPHVKLTSTLLEEATVRHVVRERVLEGVLELRIKPGLVEEVGGLQAAESAMERVVRQLRDGPEQRERHVFANDRGHLQQPFVLRREPIDARRQHRLHRRWDLDRLDRLCQPILATLPRQRFRLYQRPDRLLQEKGIPTLDEELFERHQAGIVAEKRVQELSGARACEGIET